MPSGEARSYNGAQIIASFGAIAIDGLTQAEDAINIEAEADDYEDKVGTQGEVTVSATNDNRCTITIKLDASSPTNDLFSAIRVAQKAAGILVVHPFLIKDLNGTTIGLAPKAWIKRMPNLTAGNTNGTREWVLRCAKFDVVIGGNVAAVAG